MAPQTLPLIRCARVNDEGSRTSPWFFFVSAELLRLSSFSPCSPSLSPSVCAHCPTKLAFKAQTRWLKKTNGCAWMCVWVCVCARSDTSRVKRDISEKWFWQPIRERNFLVLHLVHSSPSLYLSFTYSISPVCLSIFLHEHLFSSRMGLF